MSRDEDDEIELPALKPRTKSPMPVSDRYVKDGRFTEDGLEKLKHWWRSNVVNDAPDYECEWLNVFCDFSVSPDGFPCMDLVDENEMRRAMSAIGVKYEGDCCAGRKRDALGVQFRREDAAPAKPVEWLVEGIIPRASVCLFVAPPYELKTWLALSIARAVSYGEPWLGKHAVQASEHPLRSIHFDYEMGPDEVDRRFALLRDTRTGRSSLTPLSLSNDDLWFSELPKLGADLVTIDSLSRGHSGVTENDPKFAEPLATAAKCASLFKTTFIFLAHSPKDLRGHGLMDIIRGSGAIAANADAVYFLEARSSDSDDPRERRAKVTCRKMRRGGDEPAPFMVKLTDARGVELVERKVATPAEVEEDIDDAVLRAITESTAEGGISASAMSVDIGGRKADVLEACARLKDAGKIEKIGNGRTSRFVLVPSDS